MLLHMYQIFSSLEGHLHFSVHFFLTFMVNYFFNLPILVITFFFYISPCFRWMSNMFSVHLRFASLLLHTMFPWLSLTWSYGSCFSFRVYQSYCSEWLSFLFLLLGSLTTVTNSKIMEILSWKT